MKSCRTALSLGCFVFLALQLLNPAASHALEATIEVAPNTINIGSQGNAVTVHTDIAYSLVDVYTVFLNGLPIRSWKADNQGNFVAKFSLDEVKGLDGLVLGGLNTLQIVGLTTYGEPFVGEDDVTVIDVVPAGR